MGYVPEVCDIIFQDSEKKGAKTVKFLMTAPTIFHHLYRNIRGTQEKVEYYHPTMVVSDTHCAEQQKTVQYDSIKSELSRLKLIVIRRKNITSNEYKNMVKLVESEIGYPWGILNVFGKFLTWLTGIKLFGRYIKRKKEEVSALRIAKWYYLVFGETFGEKDYRDNNTQTMVQYCLNNPNKYEVVYKKALFWSQ